MSGTSKSVSALERFVCAGKGRRRIVAPEPDLLLPLVAGTAAHGTERPVWVVTARPEAARSVFEALRPSLGRRKGGLDVRWLPPLMPEPYAEVGEDMAATRAHLATLYSLVSGEAPPAVVVTSAVALLARTIPSARLRAFSALCICGEELDREELVETLLRGGYAREELVTEAGTFAVRGGIIDVFAPQLPKPVRVDLFGDEVERLTLFDPVSQRSGGRLEMVEIPPVSALLFTDDEAGEAETRLRELAGRCRVPSLRLATYLEDVKARRPPPGYLAFAPAVTGGLEATLPLLPEGALVVHAAEHAMRDAVEAYGARLEEGFAEAFERGRLACPPGVFLGDREPGASEIEAADAVEVCSVAVDSAGSKPPPHPDDTWIVRAEPVSHLHQTLLRRDDAEHPFRPVATTLGGWAREGLSVHVFARGASQRRRITKLVGSYGQAIEKGEGWPFAPHPPGIRLWDGRLQRGFLCRELEVAFVDEQDIFGQRPRRPRTDAPPPEHLLRSFRELTPGDMVVHRDHGIGRFTKLVRMRAGGTDGDFLEIHYRDQSKLFLPVTRISLLQRYVCRGREGHEPPLDKLGATRWQTARRKAKAAAEKIAAELLDLYARRMAAVGLAFSPPDELYEEFEATFPFDETTDQERAIREVLKDMQKTRPMDRVVCGDVGYGKTEVALRAAFKAVEDDFQVCVLVPTTILAEQHFLTMRERLRGFPVKVHQLSRFVTAAEQKEVLAEVREGKVDIVVGTHRLLQKDVRFKSLGLIVVDEEHRFGVKHKERLKAMRAEVDVLTLSATPIPRTLHMAVLGIRDLSTIATAPPGRQAIETRVVRIGDPSVKAGIERELARGGQVYFVTPRVQGMERILDELEALVPGARIAKAHGQMPARQLEDVMRAFIRGEVDILVTTTIIESGIDVQNANTMFVHRAERFGLAQLYQLRGRIGRSTRQAYCAFLIPDPRALTEDAQRRIGVLQTMTRLGSGFALAIEDMELRGAGNLLGAEQHGHIDAVGYETFMDLLHETIAEQRGIEAGARPRDTEVSVDLPAFIPDDYLPDAHDRLVLYRRFTSVRNQEELEALVSEVEDRYGRLPREAQDLVRLMSLRVTAAADGVLQIACAGSKLRMVLCEDGPVSAEAVAAFVGRPQSRWSLTPDHALERSVGPREAKDRVETCFQALRELRVFVSKHGAT